MHPTDPREPELRHRCREHGQTGFLLGEEGLADKDREMAIQGEVIPFDGIAEDAGNDGPAC